MRAKVTNISLHHCGTANSEAVQEPRDLAGYLGLAESYTHCPSPRLFITHGPSGSGKTFGSQSLVYSLGAVRIRSDVERKRLRTRQKTDRAQSEVTSNLYSPELTERTYARLAELAEVALRTGFSVVVDATFLERSQRDKFHSLANSCGVAYCILDFHPARSTLEDRIRNRRDQQRDASEATVEVLAPTIRIPTAGDRRIAVRGRRRLRCSGLHQRIAGEAWPAARLHFVDLHRELAIR